MADPENGSAENRRPESSGRSPLSNPHTFNLLCLTKNGILPLPNCCSLVVVSSSPPSLSLCNSTTAFTSMKSIRYSAHISSFCLPIVPLLCILRYLRLMFLPTPICERPDFPHLLTASSKSIGTALRDCIGTSGSFSTESGENLEVFRMSAISPAVGRYGSASGLVIIESPGGFVLQL